MPSNLSNIPPCPGKKFPVSFIFAFLFRNEKNRSPNWHAKDVEILKNKTLRSILLVIKNIKPPIVKKEKKNEPIDPDMVFLGLILVNFGPLKILPNIYPPISDPTQPKRSMNKIIFVCK